MRVPRRKKPEAYTQLVVGDWERVNMRGLSLACCDCGLAHDFQFRIVEGTLEMRAFVNKRATAAIRRPFKFKSRG